MWQWNIHTFTLFLSFLPETLQATNQLLKCNWVYFTVISMSLCTLYTSYMGEEVYKRIKEKRQYLEIIKMRLEGHLLEEQGKAI